MPRLDLEKMSVARKVALTLLGILYALAVIGNARHGIEEIVAVTLAFLIATTVVFLWVK